MSAIYTFYKSLPKQKISSNRIYIHRDKCHYAHCIILCENVYIPYTEKQKNRKTKHTLHYAHRFRFVVFFSCVVVMQPSSRVIKSPLHFTRVGKSAKRSNSKSMRATLLTLPRVEKFLERSVDVLGWLYLCICVCWFVAFITGFLSTVCLLLPSASAITKSTKASGVVVVVVIVCI